MIITEVTNQNWVRWLGRRNSPREHAIADPTIPPPDMITSYTSFFPQSSTCSAHTNPLPMNFEAGERFFPRKQRPRPCRDSVDFVSLCIILSSLCPHETQGSRYTRKKINTIRVLRLDTFIWETFSPWKCPNTSDCVPSVIQPCWQALHKTYFRFRDQSESTSASGWRYRSRPPTVLMLLKRRVL